jgi:hypothetical protein
MRVLSSIGKAHCCERARRKYVQPVCIFHGQESLGDAVGHFVRFALRKYCILDGWSECTLNVSCVIP